MTWFPVSSKPGQASGICPWEGGQEGRNRSVPGADMVSTKPAESLAYTRRIGAR